ncbi:hypothetical protein HED49_23280 [Ochrobactrum daejeonense]|nr:hypothetical protein [Brucella daejeonensis]
MQPQGEIAPALSTITTEPISTPAPTGAPEKASTPDVRGTGNLTHNIDITVPGFRGLEPKIVLNYNSARKTKVSGLYQGWLGYGWGLNGLHVIERGSLGYGVPAFDSSDVYLLNGEQLVNCSAGVVSPSCATGGTHATEIESYNRIAFNSSANEWRVTERDGTVSLLSRCSLIPVRRPRPVRQLMICSAISAGCWHRSWTRTATASNITIIVTTLRSVIPRRLSIMGQNFILLRVSP